MIRVCPRSVLSSVFPLCHLAYCVRVGSAVAGPESDVGTVHGRLVIGETGECQSQLRDNVRAINHPDTGVSAGNAIVCETMSQQASSATRRDVTGNSSVSGADRVATSSGQYA